ncbi:uncharacterized protein LOC127287614 isoform X1 [Leptopilina boulardi]|uniref:uncharacterized protein LOC127287614 isoform X1 n=1 Tax=Leptopilina boulardi TaxID=63433 RepID=UPI0021F52292|nr:uncharacterized protein LOC127287614 isoform X1 [Leptopilina boulardi]XP_051170594.1 uncharacterized protein LOC127287614 isoform X1 [Leptopilina boulardi]
MESDTIEHVNKRPKRNPKMPSRFKNTTYDVNYKINTGQAGPSNQAESNSNTEGIEREEMQSAPSKNADDTHHDNQTLAMAQDEILNTKSNCNTEGIERGNMQLAPSKNADDTHHDNQTLAMAQDELLNVS